MFETSFLPVTITGCNYIGQTVFGFVAVVLKDGIEVFRSTARRSQGCCRIEVKRWMKEVAA